MPRTPKIVIENFEPEIFRRYREPERYQPDDLRPRNHGVVRTGGRGKSTLLRVLNRLNDLVEVKKMTGRVLLDGQDIYAPDVNVIELRRG